MPKVSIILPTYNGEQYLKQAIDSIFAQTCSDWELILVDDCSTDGTSHIADQYAASDSRVRVIHNKQNERLPKSLNIGFSVAIGKYLTWTSDDNLYMPEAIAEMAGYLDQHAEAAMVRCDMQIINSEGEITGLSGIYTDEKMYTYNCLGACFLYRKEVREQIGDYDTDTFCVEDYDYWLRVMDCFGQIVPIHKVLYQYRRHEGSLSEMRKMQVLDQLTKLRIRYLDKILHAVRNNPGELCRIYYEMRRSQRMTSEVEKQFQQIVPELCDEVPLSEGKKYIIFAAGKYGEKAAVFLGSHAAAFADNDSAKTGTIKCGLEIQSFQNAAASLGENCFIIAVAGKRIYEMIIQLRNAGITEFSVFNPGVRTAVE